MSDEKLTACEQLERVRLRVTLDKELTARQAHHLLQRLVDDSKELGDDAPCVLSVIRQQLERQIDALTPLKKAAAAEAYAASPMGQRAARRETDHA